jgi:hypothetical protein
MSERSERGPSGPAVGQERKEPLVRHAEGMVEQ